MIGSLLICIVIPFQKIGEKEHFHHDEEYEQFHKYDDPQGFPDGHSPESFIIKIPHPAWQSDYAVVHPYSFSYFNTKLIIILL